MTPEQIAAAQGTSLATVRTHVRDVLARLVHGAWPRWCACCARASRFGQLRAAPTGAEWFEASTFPERHVSMPQTVPGVAFSSTPPF